MINLIDYHYTFIIMKIQLLSILLFILLPLMLFSQDSKISVGILDFTPGEGVSENDAVTITEIFRSELIKSGKFTVLEREKLDQVLEEQSLQVSGITEEQFAVRIGKILNMEKMIYGSIRKFGSHYFIIINLLDIETAQLEQSINQEIETLDSIPIVLKPIVNQLISQKDDPLHSPESSYTLIQDLLNQSLFRHFQQIRDESANLLDKDKTTLFNQYQKKAFLPLGLNLIPGFGVGSFLQKDLLGGISGLLCDTAVVTSILIITFVVTDETLNIIPAVIFLSSKIFQGIRPFLYTGSYNRRLREALRIK